MSSALIENNTPEPEKIQHLVAGRYRTLTRIGHGRLGEIYSAVDESYQEIGVEQRRAIQVIPESVVRNNKLFNKLNVGYSEFRAGSHPNFVDYIHLGRDGRFGYLVMELLDGASLRLALDIAESLPLEEVKPVIRGAGEALRLLHTKGIVHGNLNTRNVFITDDLEIRLLDVLPIDPAEPLVRGITASNPFSQISVQDDVFGLACLAYEMLSGKHPFNYSSLAEARTAGLEAERINSLGNSEWHAIHRALSFDDEIRTASVAAFMHEFGIDGTERLQPVFDEPVAPPPVVVPAMEVSRPAIGPADIEQPAVHVAPVSAIDDWPAPPRPVQKRSSPLRAAFLGMLLVGLCAWWYVGEPEEIAVVGIGYLDEKLNLGLTRQHEGIVDIPAMAAVQTAATVRVSGVDAPVPAAPAAMSDVAIEDSVVGPPQPEPAATSEVIGSNVEQTAEPAVPVTSAEVEGSTADVVAAPNQPADEPAAEPMTESPGIAPVLTIPETQIAVSERAGAARIVVRRNGNSDTPVTWWTSEDSAFADDDFIAVLQRTMNLPAREDNDVLHIPLINDNLPERRESFFVNFGIYDAREGRIERIASVRVDIIDDD